MSTIQIIYSDKLTNLTEKDKLKLNHGIMHWVFDELNKIGRWDIVQKANEWTINIHESEESKLEEFKALVAENEKLDEKIPHGITLKNKKEVHAFIPKEGGTGSYAIRPMFSAISHEICHMMLAILVDFEILEKRSKRRMQDKLNPPGSEANTETTEVHDRANEIKQNKRQPKKLRVSSANIGGHQMDDFELVGIDITDLLQKARRT